MKKFLFVSVVIFLVAIPILSLAIDWWPMFGHDLEHTGYSNSSFKITKLNLTWNISLSSPGYAFNYMDTTPTVKDNKVFINTENYFYIYDIENKTTLRFNHSIAPSVETPEAYAVPAIENGIVCYSDQGQVYCRNSTTGSLLWNYSLAGLEFMYLSPIISRGILFTGSERHEANPRLYDVNPRFYAFNLTTGLMLWNFSILNQTDMAVHTYTPSISKGIIYAPTAEMYDGICCFNNYSYLLAFNQTTGSLIGNYSTKGFGSFYLNSPTIISNKIFITTHKDTDLAASLLSINKNTGKLIWRKNLTELSHDFERSTPVVYKGAVIVASFNNTHFNIYAFNQTNGALIWQNTKEGRIWSSPSLAKNKLFIGSLAKKIYVFDINTGSLLLNHSLSISSGIQSTPSIVAGVALFGDEKGVVYAFDSEPDITNTKINITKTTKIISVTAKIEDLTLNKSSVKVYIKNINGTIKKTLNLYDDGLHNDGAANDGIFGNSWNVSDIKKNYTYLADIIASDKYSLQTIITHFGILSLADSVIDTYSNTSINIPSSGSTLINSSDLNITLELNVNADTTGSVNIISYSENPKEENVVGAQGIGIYEIELTNTTKANLSSAIIKIYYDDASLLSQGIAESTLKMYYWNTTLSAWKVIPNSGVNTISNYVWANVTHFSTYGAFGEATANSPTTSNGGDSNPPNGIRGYCGDAYCNPFSENCNICQEDCGICPAPANISPITATATEKTPTLETSTQSLAALPSITGAVTSTPSTEISTLAKSIIISTLSLLLISTMIIIARPRFVKRLAFKIKLWWI